MEERAKVKERNGRGKSAKDGGKTENEERNGGSGEPEREFRVTSHPPYVRQECARDSLVNLSSKHIVRA